MRKTQDEKIIKIQEKIVDVLETLNLTYSSNPQYNLFWVPFSYDEEKKTFFLRLNFFENNKIFFGFSAPLKKTDKETYCKLLQMNEGLIYGKISISEDCKNIQYSVFVTEQDINKNIFEKYENICYNMHFLLTKNNLIEEKIL